MDKKKTQKIVKEAYSKIAQGQEGCGCGTSGSDNKEFATRADNREVSFEAKASKR